MTNATNTKKVCLNCDTRFLDGQRKCRGCGNSVRLSRCETVEEVEARNKKDDAIEAMLQKILNGEPI